MANGDNLDNLDLLGQSLDQVNRGAHSDLDYDPANVDYYGLIDYKNDNVAEELHQAQSGMRQFGSGLFQAGAEIVGGTIEGIGYLGDVEDTYDALVNGQVEVGNFISEFGKSIKEDSKEVAPVYSDPFKEGEFSPEDWSWWMSNMPSIASSISLMIPSGVATQAVSGIGKGLGLSKLLGKTGSFVGKGITQATISRQMESFMEAAGVQDETYNALVSRGVSDERAKEEAGKAAASNYKANWAMLAQDIVQYTTLIKPFGKATRDLSVKTARKLGKDVTPVIMDKFASIGSDMVGEAAEEGYQYIAGQRAREMAEYRAGLRSKRSLGSSVGDYMGDGDFWSGAFFGALGAGAMQTAGKSLNMAKERVRNLEDEDTKRLRDIDSWGQSVQGLGNLDSTGEAMGTPDFNSKNRQLAEFGSKLAQNGNLGWFLETADNFQNMSKEDQEMFGFTPEDLEESKKQFPTLKQDLEKIGKIYEDTANNKTLTPAAQDMVVQEQFIADKTLEQYNKENGVYSSSVNNITGLSNLNVPASTKDLIIKEKLELNNLLKVRKDLKDNNASEGVISELDTRIKDLRSEIKEDKSNLATFPEHKYKTFNTRSTDFQAASKAFRKKEFLSAEHKESMEKVDYYSDPDNQKEIATAAAIVDKLNAEQASEQASTAQEVSDLERESGRILQREEIQEEPSGDDLMTDEYAPGGPAIDLTKFNKEKAKEQATETAVQLDTEGKKAYESVSEAVSKKYSGNPHLLNEDVKKILNFLKETNLQKEFTEEELVKIFPIARGARLNLKGNRDLKPFQVVLTQVLNENEKLFNKLFEIINLDATKAQEVKSTTNTKEASEPEKTNSVGTEEEKSGISIRVVDKKTDRRLIKDRSGSDFTAVNYVAGKGPKELGIDQEALNKGKVKIGDKVTFRVDKQDSYEKTNKDNVGSRGFDMVVNGVVIGKVPTESEKKTDEENYKINALREILQEQINSKYDSKKRYIEADITTTVSGAFYNYTRTKELGRPSEKISKKDQSKFKKAGGFVFDFIELKNDKYYLSGKTGLANLGIEVENEFKQHGEAKIDGSLIVLVPHPIEPNKQLFLKGFLNTLGQVGDNNQELYSNIRSSLVGLFKEYRDNKAQRNTTAKSIKDVIIRDFDVQGNNLILKKRDKNLTVSIPLDIFESSPEFNEWLDDSKMAINKDKINQPSAYHTIGSYTTELMPYNKLIDNFISMSIESGQYLDKVQILVNDIDSSKPTEKPKVEPIPEPIKEKKRNPLELDEDPGEVVPDAAPKQNNPKAGVTTEVIKKEKPSRKPQFNQSKLTDGRGSRADKLIEQAKKNKDNKTRNRKVLDINAKPWNKQEELDWLKKNFPGVDVSVLSNLQEVVANGSEAWGVFHNAAIYIAENAAVGTVYHEAFHALFNLFNNQNQRESILKEAAIRYKDIKLNISKRKSIALSNISKTGESDYDSGNTEHISKEGNNEFYGLANWDIKQEIDRFYEKELSIALEEALADEFMEYVQTEIADKSWSKAIKDFFTKIYQTIKSLWKNPIYSIDEMFWRGNNGFYSQSNVNSETFADPVTRYRVPSWTYKQNKEATSAVNGYLMTEIVPEQRRLNPDMANLTDVEVINTAKLGNLYKVIVDDFVKLKDSGVLIEEESDNIQELINNFYDFEAKSFKKELHSELLRGLEFYDIKVDFSNDDTFTVGQFDSEDAQEDDLKEAEEKAQDKREGWQDSAQERSTKDNALQEVKVFIRNMELSGYKNVFGLPSLVDYQETYDTLLKNLAGTTHIDDTIEMLEMDKILHPEYQQILNKFKENPIFQTKFFNAFNKNHTKYNMISFINGNWAVYQANRKGLVNTIISQWSEGIITNKNLVKIDSQGNITIKESAKEIVKDIRTQIKETLEGWKKDNEVDYYKPLSKAISKLGIEIEPKVFHYIGAEKKSRLNYFLNTGKGNFGLILNKFNDLKNPFDAEGGLDVGESLAIKTAANMVAKASPELYESSFRNIDGKTVYAHLEQNFLTKLTHKLQNEARRPEMVENYLKDQMFYVMDSDNNKVITNRILRDLNSGKNIFDIMVTEGMSNDEGDRVSYKNLDNVGLKLYTIHNYFNNNNKAEAWYRGPVLSDAPNGVVFKHTKNDKTEVLNSLVDLASSEYNRIQSIGEQLKSLPESDRIKNYHIPENANTATGYHLVQGMRTFKGDPSKNRAKALKHIEAWLTEKTKDYYNSLEQSGIIVMTDGKIDAKKSRLDSRLVNQYSTEKAFKEFLLEFYVNDFLSRAEFNLMTTGDPAFYKSSPSGNYKLVDFIKRTKEIYSPKSILDVTAIDPKTNQAIGATYRTMYLQDNEIQSPSFESIKKAIEGNKSISKQKKAEIIASYGKVNQTDAQAYITLPFYRRTMLGMGKWTSKHESAYERLEQGKGTGSDVSLMLQPLKPFAYGQVYSDKLGRLIPVQNKNSEYLLLSQLALKKKDGQYVNEELANLYNFMNGAKVDSVNFESAVKAGLSRVIPKDTFKTAESTEKFIKETMNESVKDWTHILNMEDRGIQQEVPEHFLDANNLFGTQIRKLIMSDLFEGTTYFGDKNPIELRKMYEDLIMADLQEAYEEVNGSLVNEKTGEVDYKAVYDVLLDESRKRGKGEEFEKAIQYDGKNNRLELPLFNPITARSAQNLITSLFKTRITKQKIAGGAFVQLSSFGLSDQLELVYNNNGGLQHAQVMLPAWSRKFFQDFINEDGDVDFAAIERNIPEVLEMVGYRIPTEDKYSMLPMKVIGFLPSTAGGAIMLPADITQISGSDFDVDKMYVMMKSFEVNRKLTPDAYKIIADKLKVTVKDMGKALTKAEKNQELTDEESKIVDDYKKIDKDPYLEATYSIHEYDDSKSAQKNSKLARDNRKIDIMMSVLQNPNTLEAIMSGGTFKFLQDVAEVTQNKTGKTNRSLDPISIESMDQMHIDNMTGNSMVGIAANENAFHAIAQHADLKLKTSVSFDNTSLTSLSETKAQTFVAIPLNNDGSVNYSDFPPKIITGKDVTNKISKNKAYYLAAIVDNAKDPVASYINYNSYTSGIVGLLSQVGIDPATITWFLKQPVIQEITDEFFKSGQDFNIESSVINKYKKHFGIKRDPKMAPMLHSLKLYDSLKNKPTDKSQKEVFEAFLVYKKLAKDWTSLVLSSRADTKGFGPTLADSEHILDAIEKVQEDSFGISGVLDLFDDDLLNDESDKTKLVAAFTEYGINKPLKIVNEMFPYAKETGFYREIKKELSFNIKGRELSVKERNIINDQITTYLLSKYTAFNPNDRDYYLKEFPKEFLEFSEKNPIFADNYLIRRLSYQSNKSDKKTPIERVIFNNTGALNNEQKNDIQKAWLDLYESEEFRPMAEKLFHYTYFTSGMAFGANSFSHLMPVDLMGDNGIKDNYDNSLASFMWEIIETNVITSDELDEFVNQFYRNNYKNKAFVPRVNEDGSNVLNSEKNNKGQVIGFTVTPNVKDTSLILNEIETQYGEIVYTYAPFISYEKNDKIYLYQNVSKDNNVAVYVLTNKLGFPNYTFEYQKGAFGLKSSYEFNNVGDYSVTDFVKYKPKENNIYEVNEVLDIEGKNLMVNTYEIKPGDSYSITFTYNKKTYTVEKTQDGKYLKNGKPVSETSALVTMFRKAADLIGKNNCGYGS